MKGSKNLKTLVLEDHEFLQYRVFFWETEIIHFSDGVSTRIYLCHYLVKGGWQSRILFSWTYQLSHLNQINHNCHQSSSCQWLMKMVDDYGWWQWLMMMVDANGWCWWLMTMVDYDGWRWWLMIMVNDDCWWWWLIKLVNDNGWWHWLIMKADDDGWWW